jgi:hypothetical protein
MKFITGNYFKLCIISLLFFPEIIIAQPFFDLLNIKYQYLPKRPYSDHSNSNFNGSLAEANVMVPFVQKDKSALLAGITYRKFNFVSTGSVNAEDNLYSFIFLCGYSKQWKNEKWKTLFMFIPKMNSDLEKVNHDSYQFGGLVLCKYKKSEKINFHFGLYYNSELFGPYFMPIVGIDWKINDRLNIFGDMPSNLSLEYKINKSLYSGITYNSFVSTYTLNSPGYNTYVRQGDTRWGDNQIKLFMNWYATKRIVIYLDGGATFFRIFTLYDYNDEPVYDRNSVFRKADNGALINLGIAYRIRLD